MGKSLLENIKVKEAGGFKDRLFIPRIWNGMRITSYLSMLWRNAFLAHPIRWPMMTLHVFSSCIASSFSLVQKLTYGSKIAKTEPEHDPVFIVGHWRSGTTMLHELLMRDEQFTCPDTFACFTPEFFLVSKWFVTTILKLPNKRPMDNMKFGWETPQEDEFALCAMGIPSPYLHLAFPNNMKWEGRYESLQKYLDLSNLTEKEMNRWKKGLHWFVKALTVRDPRRLAMKSPTHTARIRVLREMYPNAKFIHISRNPYTLYASTVNLWKRFLISESYQRTDGTYLEELVFESLERMYRAYIRDTEGMSPEDLIEIRYEDLCADLVGTMEKVYAQLNLGDFEKVRPNLEAYVEEHKDYKKNKFEIEQELCDKITERWKIYLDRFGGEVPQN